MKYTLINCYTDNNKGDLGIIQSTIQFLKKNDNNAQIVGISTYNYDDPLYKTDHIILSEEIKVLPAIFGELNCGENKSFVAKIVCLFLDSLRMLIYLFIPNNFIFNEHERETLECLKDSDYIISKGGSFLCSEDSLRTKVAFVRFIYIFLLSLRLKRAKIIILCQSLGPIYGFFYRKILNFILQKCYRIVLREDLCLAQYPYIKVPKENTFVLNDIAFFLKSEQCSLNLHEGRKVGITIKSVSPLLQEKYNKMMKLAIEYLITEKKAFLYVFPHVTIDDDLEAGFKVYRMVKDIYKDKIVLLTGNYTSKELKWLYGNMDFMISTRLHSAIFAIGEGVPAINIAYHGTKSQGIYMNMELDDLLITKYDENDLINTIDILDKNIDCYKEKINRNLIKYEALMCKIINSILTKRI